MNTKKLLISITFLSVLVLPMALVVQAKPLSGAIFTTTVDGSIVNENVHYEAKEDVYLDGGPGPNAPSTAAGLPEGDYYFQVTDPSGKDLLSTDHISCRMIHVNEYGVIDFAYPGINYEYQNGKDSGWIEVECQHNTGIDVDHEELGAITVQLFPYDDTPNPGGVYKVWITPVEEYAPINVFDPTGDKRQDVNNEGYAAGNFHGFIPAHSKTDNYKVKKHGKPYVPPMITVLKFHDKNINGIQDVDEETIEGWLVEVTDTLGVTNTVYTTALVDAPEPGTYIFVEDTPTATLQTVSTLDGIIVSQYPLADPTVLVPVIGESEETHEVVYGNVGLGSITATKIYDRNGNGVVDPDEPSISGWKMELTGMTVTGITVGPIVQMTDIDGSTTFSNLLPGTYTVAELIPENGGWISTGSTSYTVTIESSLIGSTVYGSEFEKFFTNYCVGSANFDTKGYWHNKNGLQELTDDDRDYVNTLAPYAMPSNYFSYGDEPFDGFFSDNTPVIAAYNNDDYSMIWGSGTWQAEVSHFLVDANAGGDPREQLAQQLLAFIFNTQHRLDNPAATILLPDGNWVSAQSVIDSAINAWITPDYADDHYWEPILDQLNNNDAVNFIHFYACVVMY
ncbi:MAG: hypothetical protein JSV04_08785 [Candidatus Heimdallarchaeota archaeon]|nr:MAG: hypothetical protein JSV04_08785 [Candidatus Heimdallarchaeota archaeon]